MSFLLPVTCTVNLYEVALLYMRDHVYSRMKVYVHLVEKGACATWKCPWRLDDSGDGIHHFDDGLIVASVLGIILNGGAVFIVREGPGYQGAPSFHPLASRWWPHGEVERRRSGGAAHELRGQRTRVLHEKASEERLHINSLNFVGCVTISPKTSQTPV